MENDSERMMMQMMANMMAGKRDEEPERCSSCRIDFFERENAVDSQAEGVFSRMLFKGCFAIDGYVIQNAEGEPVESGLGADFDEANGPTAAWVWFCRPANDAVKEKFQEFFGGSFDESGQRMDISTDRFVAFSDSKSWGSYEEAFGGSFDEDENDALW